MQKREFLKITGLSIAGMALANNLFADNLAHNLGNSLSAEHSANAASSLAPNATPFELPKLNYAFDALEPHIDKQTMEIHFSKHHQSYVTNLNKALENDALKDKTLLEILGKVTAKQAAIRNNAGGHYNHTLYWEILSPNPQNMPTGALFEAIKTQFGSVDALKEQLSKAGMERFGSGWAWLCMDKKKKLCVCSTPNQDNPLMKKLVKQQGTPLIGIDVWEHAYYLKHQNKRAEYLKNFFNVLDWAKVEKKFGA